jgi:hypothetical protein
VEGSRRARPDDRNKVSPVAYSHALTIDGSLAEVRTLFVLVLPIVLVQSSLGVVNNLIPVLLHYPIVNHGQAHAEMIF